MTAPGDKENKMEHKHTPAPWRLDDAIHGHLIDDGYHFIDAGAGCYAEGDRDGFGIQGCLNLANASLITAAPELLEALEAVDNGYRCGHDLSLVIGEVRAAIAKATGAQP